MSGSTLDRVIDTDDLDVEIRTIAAQLNVLNARLAEITQRVVDADLLPIQGLRTPANYLVHKAGLSPAHARQIVRIARHRAEFPTVMASFDRGQLSADQVAEAVRAPAWADEQIHHLCTISTVPKLRRALRSSTFEGDPDEPASSPESTTRETVAFGTRGGRWRLTAELDLDAGRRVEAALAERRDALFADGDESVTWVEAFTDCFERSLAGVESASRRDRYRTWLHLDVSDGNTTTTDGWRLPDPIAERLLCDGAVQPVWESEGVPFSVGRSQHVVPERTRRIIERRDRGCRVPGCANSRHVEIHHIEHWLAGGRTDTANLISLCGAHHKLHHQGVLGISGNADLFDDVVFTDRAGEAIPGVAPPLGGADPPEVDRPYKAPLIGRFDWNWVGLGYCHPKLTPPAIRAALARNAAAA